MFKSNFGHMNMKTDWDELLDTAFKASSPCKMHHTQHANPLYSVLFLVFPLSSNMVCTSLVVVRVTHILFQKEKKNVEKPPDLVDFLL